MASKAHGDQVGFKKWAPLIVMGLAVIIIVLDTTLLNVSLRYIVRDLHTTVQSLQWVITAYSLTLAALTITGGRLGDLFGRKRMFVAGAIIFAAGSLLASLSNNVTMLLVGESIIEGIGAALMMPATASLLVANYKGHDRSLALGVWGGMAAVGAALGPLLGGYLTTNFSWRWGFRINVVVAALLVAGAAYVHDGHEKDEEPWIDWLGIVLSATGLFLFVYAIIEGSSYGWWKSIGRFKLFGVVWTLGLSVVPIAILLAVVLLGTFFWWEQRVTKHGKTPLVSIELFKVEQFRDGALLTAVLSVGQIGLIFGLPVFLQSVRHLDALHTGYALIPMSLGLMVMAPLGGFLSRRFLPKRIIQTGLGMASLGLFLLLRVLSTKTTLGDLIFPMALYGAGFGLNMSQLSNITLSAISVNQSGEASGVNNTLRQVGSSFGTAIIGSIIIASLGSGLRHGIATSPVFSADKRDAIAHQINNGEASSVEFGGSFSGGTKFTRAETAEVQRIAAKSAVVADKRGFVFTLFTTLAAFLLAARLPKTRDLEKNQSLANPPRPLTDWVTAVEPG